MKLWKYQSPWFFDEFDRLEEVFPAASYQYVLYGMGFESERAAGYNRYRDRWHRGAQRRMSGMSLQIALAAAEEPRAPEQDQRVRAAARLRDTTRDAHDA